MTAELSVIVGEEHVLTDPDVIGGHVVDWTGRFHGATPAVVRPGSTEEVAAVIAACRRSGTAIVPQGGNTGLVGGSVPLAGEMVVSLRRLAAIGEVDRIAGQVTVGAGVTLEQVQAAARASGMEFAVDLAARGSATIGGMIATNAGGTRVIRYGSMRAQVLGVEAVLGTGAVVSNLHGLLKDNTGYDLAGLLCGSEGTLGIVTAARLRLVPALAARTTVLLALPDIDSALRCVAAARRTNMLDAAEVLFANGMSLVCDHLGISPPIRPAPASAVYLVLEAAADSEPTDRLLDALDGNEAIGGTAVGTTSSQRAELWRYREAHTEAINSRGVPHKMDVTLPFASMQRFCDEVVDVVEAIAPDAETFLFGHLGDGNIHVNVVGGLVPDAVDDAVLRLVASYGGSISAEHGIGTAKRHLLHLSRSAEEIAAFRSIKAALDPDGILNPNVLLPAGAGYA